MSGTISGEKDLVRQFWNRNVCQADQSQADRASRQYFEQIENVRYKYHYHLYPLFDRIAAICGSSGRLLEVGCGMGTDLLQLARRNLNVTGVDLTEAGIELARKRFNIYGLHAELRVADAEHLPFNDGEFDIVYSFGVLHHTPDTAGAIRETHRVLRPGGMAFVMLYHRHSLNYLAHRLTGIPFDGSKKDKCPVERAYSKKEIRDMFVMYDQTAISIDYLFGTGWGLVNRLMPTFFHRALGKIIGWHAMIEAKK